MFMCMYWLQVPGLMHSQIWLTCEGRRKGSLDQCSVSDLEAVFGRSFGSGVSWGVYQEVVKGTPMVGGQPINVKQG